MARVPKVRTAKTRHTLLAHLEQRTDAALLKITQTGMRLATKEVRHGRRRTSQLFPLEKYVGATAEAVTNAVEASHRRIYHGAIHGPAGQLPLGIINRLLGTLPFKAGHLATDPTRRHAANPPFEDTEAREVWTPVNLVVGLDPIKAETLRSVLNGDAVETVRLVRHADDSGHYSAETGAATVLAAKLTHVPSLLALVRPNAEPSPGQGDPPLYDLDNLIETAKRYTEPHCYTLPSYLEPLAELARQYDPDTFHRGLNGQPLPEEEAAQNEADHYAMLKAATYNALYKKYRATLATTAAQKAAYRDPQYRLAAKKEEKALELRQQTMERAHQLKETFNRARRGAQALALVDQRPYLEPDHLWERARHQPVS